MATPPASGAGERWFDSSQADCAVEERLPREPHELELRVRIPPALLEGVTTASTPAVGSALEGVALLLPLLERLTKRSVVPAGQASFRQALLGA